ncbi:MULTISPECIES: hypothetical protein [Acetobacter]|uniref:Uncharacterized protein n=1 Tax=Acetobacter pomorum TaxID=65959 RepID=A0AAN1U8D9_9PROT|nr:MULTISPECIES: hypothetical protein [Acetobacter]AXM99708.1 hypothetical protein CJF59_03430 [Acetobacter pomorum]
MIPVPVHRALAGCGCLGDGVLGGGWQRTEGRQGKSSARSGLHVVGLIGEFALSPRTTCGCPGIFPNLFNDPGAVRRASKRRAGHADAR